jgi:hypothetical protein
MKINVKTSGASIRQIRAALAVVSILALAALGGFGLSLHQVLDSHRFVEVPGEILAADYGSPRDKRGESTSERRQRRNTTYFNVRYCYRFDQRDHAGDRIQAGTFGWISAANKRDFESRFRVGSKVPVFIDPENPGTAVLVRGWSHITTMLGVISAVLVLVASGLLTLSWPKRR